DVTSSCQVLRDEGVAQQDAAHAVHPLVQHVAAVGHDLAGLDPALTMLFDDPGGGCSQGPHGGHGQEVTGGELEVDHQGLRIGRAHADSVDELLRDVRRILIVEDVGAASDQGGYHAA